ncbi:hypothetical protein DLJ53_30520 [Acuticoccus sediminis]|uniref:3-oxoacyl-[acyl-carrier protein] reductase n=1 Tax=Acuticoccus sediminis TaxID=2184697 RepID=A0A8B2NQ47_9HYPH|nr:SDR family NAD(P)-dependent oxidoreductase [Acuticoccus sediminis]RAH97011.1 hypothetical protein DLJ53_30520 [Acuticoccus sediminis]
MSDTVTILPSDAVGGDPQAAGALRGAAALVAGGSGRLGRLVALGLAREGAAVAVGYRTGDKRAAAVVDAVTGAGGRAIAVPLDQTDEAYVSTAVETTAHFLGGVDILVNAAGIAHGRKPVAAGDLDALTPLLWDQLMTVNLRGPYLLARAAAPYLRASRWGRIVNVGAHIGPDAAGSAAACATSIASVASLTRFLAAALAPDVAVHCVAPALKTVPDPADAAGGSTRPGTAPQTPSGLDEVARRVLAHCLGEDRAGETSVFGAVTR